MASQSSAALRPATPRASAPATNFSFCSTIWSRFFLPIALRRTSASPIEKPATSTAICITCSW